MKTILARVGAFVLAKNIAWYIFRLQVILRNRDKGFALLIYKGAEKVWNAKYEGSAKVSRTLAARGQSVNAAFFRFLDVRAQNNELKYQNLVERVTKK